MHSPTECGWGAERPRPGQLELAPGSMVFLNGRCFHGVRPRARPHCRFRNEAPNMFLHVVQRG
jgi:hypothetical protein